MPSASVGDCVYVGTVRLITGGLDEIKEMFRFRDLSPRSDVFPLHNLQPTSCRRHTNHERVWQRPGIDHGPVNTQLSTAYGRVPLYAHPVCQGGGGA